MRFWLIIASFPILDIAWWIWANRKLGALPNPKPWRRLLALFVLFQFLGLTGLFVTRATGIHAPYPVTLLAALYLWHLIVLPITVLLTLLAELLIGSVNLAKWTLRRPSSVGFSSADAASDLNPEPRTLNPLTRRQFLAASAVVAPPLLTGAAVTTSLLNIQHFRHRDLTLKIPNLPPALDGLTIAHVSDIHIGRFTPISKLESVVQETNARKPDLVLLTGDLIDFALRDLPRAIDMVKQFTPRLGLAMCEGNHDLIENRFVFEQDVKQSGVPLLLNESKIIDVNGHPLQLLGIRWGGRSGFESATTSHVANTLRLRKKEAFPILLAHHPHAFDPAAEADIPLTLAGHTHGGQLMLTPNIGPGPLMYKYWSGLYQQKQSQLVVSNGVGNWFPLRLNAPAEILHLTLRPA